MICNQECMVYTILLMASVISLAASLPTYKTGNGTQISEASNASVTNDSKRLPYTTLSEEELQSLSPLEYYKAMGASSDVISFLTGHTSTGGRHRARRSVSLCPVTYRITFYADRKPQHIRRAVCNGPQSMCLSSSGALSCKEFYMPLHYQQEIGGEWKIRSENVPVGCFCAA